MALATGRQNRLDALLGDGRLGQGVRGTGPVGGSPPMSSTGRRPPFVPLVAV